jgi:CRP-like cAMP-binding protein
VIHTNDFKKLLDCNRKRRETALLAELKILPMLINFTPSHLKKFVSCFNPLKLLMHQYLYKENTPATHVYIVRKGEFKTTIRMSLPNVKSTIEASEVFKDSKKAMKGTNKYFVKNTAQSFEIIDLQIIGRDQFIGEEDCAANDFYHTTV